MQFKYLKKNYSCVFEVLWNLTIPGGKPTVKPWPTVNVSLHSLILKITPEGCGPHCIENMNDQKTSRHFLMQSPKNTQRVLHLSDIHIDRDYAEGSEADCEVLFLKIQMFFSIVTTIIVNIVMIEALEKTCENNSRTKINLSVFAVEIIHRY